MRSFAVADDVGQSLLSEASTSISNLWSIVENEEYVEIITDQNGQFLWGIKEDGSVEWAKGIPTPIREICPSDKIDDPEWLFLWCVKDGGERYPLMGIKKDYTFWCAKDNSMFDVDRLEMAIYNLTTQLQNVKNDVSNELNVHISSLNTQISDINEAYTLLEGKVSSLEHKEIKESDCSEDLLQLIESSGGGPIVNAADGQDITSVNNKLQLAERPFGLNNYGYVRLRKDDIENALEHLASTTNPPTSGLYCTKESYNLFEGNLSKTYYCYTVSPMSAVSTIYEVVHTHDLGGRLVCMPENCVLYWLSIGFE